MNVRIHHPLRIPQFCPGTPHSARLSGRPPRKTPRPRPGARWRKPPSHRALGAGFALSGLALAAGCSAAPAGATANSPAIGPVRTGAAARNFAPFPVPAQWNGEDDVLYAMAVKSTSGTTPRKFAVTVKPSMVFWLNCIGVGDARLTSPVIGLKWGIPCGNGADPQAITVAPPPAAQGKPVKVLVTASAGARWEVRVDEPVPAAG